MRDKVLKGTFGNRFTLLAPVQQVAQVCICLLFGFRPALLRKCIAAVAGPAARKIFAYYAMVARPLQQNFRAIVDLRYSACRQEERHDLTEAGHIPSHAVKDSVYVMVIRKYLMCFRIEIKKIVA